jgi:hypothetical protein
MESQDKLEARSRQDHTQDTDKEKTTAREEENADKDEDHTRQKAHVILCVDSGVVPILNSIFGTAGNQFCDGTPPVYKVRGDLLSYI